MALPVISGEKGSAKRGRGEKGSDGSDAFPATCSDWKVQTVSDGAVWAVAGSFAVDVGGS